MNNLTRALLGSVALGALAAAPATARPTHPTMHVTALHAGKVVNKTRMSNPAGGHITYTFHIYSYQSSNAPPKTHLPQTFYQFNTEGVCDYREHRMKVPKRSIYAKIGTATETYSFGCSNGPSMFYGDTWTNRTGKSGDIDVFTSTLISTFKANGTKYKATLNLDVEVFIQ